MVLIREARKRARHIIVPVFAAAIAGYFLYHTVQGERGAFAYAKLSEQVREAEIRLAGIKSRRETLETDVRLLRPDSLDLDLLEERARAVLNLIDDDDILIHQQPAR